MSSSNVQFSVAAHILAVIGCHRGGEVKSALLASSVNAQPAFVRRALAKLSKAGLVIATRGRNGSSVLSRDPREISLLDIYLASEAPSTFFVHEYPIDNDCPVSRNFKDSMSMIRDKSQSAFEASLARQTLADLIENIESVQSDTGRPRRRKARQGAEAATASHGRS
ncbi:Rrf2 family transcriptional regulator [Caballeronia insecticola]|nr:Rrf2 family transcriptional regulator [Caballeronia insecticola]